MTPCQTTTASFFSHIRVLVADALGAPTSQPQAPARYDILIRNGRVLDGSGNPWLAADLGIRGGRIADMGRLGNAPAARVIDAQRAHRRRPASSTCTRTRRAASPAS